MTCFAHGSFVFVVIALLFFVSRSSALQTSQQLLHGYELLKYKLTFSNFIVFSFILRVALIVPQSLLVLETCHTVW